MREWQVIAVSVMALLLPVVSPMTALAQTEDVVMVFSLLEEERMKWQKVGMRAEDIAWIEEASRALEQEPMKLEFLEEALVA